MKNEIFRRRGNPIDNILDWIQSFAIFFFVMFFLAPFIGPFSPLATMVLATLGYFSNKAEEESNF